MFWYVGHNAVESEDTASKCCWPVVWLHIDVLRLHFTVQSVKHWELHCAVFSTFTWWNGPVYSRTESCPTVARLWWKQPYQYVWLLLLDIIITVFSRTLQFHRNVRLLSWYVVSLSSVKWVSCLVVLTEVNITRFSHKSMLLTFSLVNLIAEFDGVPLISGSH